MRILVSGSHGLVGKALIELLKKNGHEVSRLVRNSGKSERTEIFWDPINKSIDKDALEGFDVVVHLAGENIASGRWTDEKKRRIRESRVNGTRVLSDALINLASPPRVLVSASAIGYYGNRGDDLLTEQSKAGDDFLSSVCVEWEQQSKPATEKGTRVVQARFGIILDQAGGALAKMLPPFRMGVGGKLGDGRQWMSWIALDDVVSGLMFVVQNENISGPVNFVAPSPIRNIDFTKALGQVLSRPTLFPVPSFVIRTTFGEMGEALLLTSQRVSAEKLTMAGYQFLYPNIREALSHILN